MAKNNKCKKCSLDCEVTRAMALGNVSPSEKKKMEKAKFGDKKPVYTQATCPKK
ncbi:MAG: hypothetical protein KAJ39_06410 [Gammaproteobacteria bacterium]|nr:hypothetical protein [Gammaproteobacteria bacterium]